MPSKDILPLKEHIELLLEGDVNTKPCDTCAVSEVEISLPEWFDREKYKRGQRYINNNYQGILTGTLAGMICVLALPSMLTIFLKTHRSSTVKGAYRRYVSTMFHLKSWYNEELKPGSTPWKSLTTVRTRHLRTSRTSERRHDGPLSQRDLVFGQFAFVGIGLLRPRYLGMEFHSDEDREGFVHFWRTIGYMIGIDDKYNLCRPSFQETIDICHAMCNEVFQPFLQDPPEYFHYMVSVLIEGMWYLNPGLSEGYFMFFTYRQLGVEGFYLNEAEKQAEERTQREVKKRKTYKLTKNFKDANTQTKSKSKKLVGEDFYAKMGWYNKIFLYLMVQLHEKLCYTRLGRWYFNAKTRSKMVWAKYFPYVCFWRFGFAESFVNMFAEDKRYVAVPVSNKDMLMMQKY